MVRAGAESSPPYLLKKPEQLRVGRYRLTAGSGVLRLGRAGWAERALPRAGPNTRPGDPEGASLGGRTASCKGIDPRPSVGARLGVRSSVVLRKS